MCKYEGWANYQTWNVALWISNERTLYDNARKFSQKHGFLAIYENFVKQMPSEYGDITADRVSWTDPTLDLPRLDEFIQELGE